MRPRTTDVLLGTAVAVVLSIVVASDQGEPGPVNPLAYLWAVGLGLLMLVRRTHPLLVLALTTLGFFTYYAAGFPAIGVAVPIAAALFSAAEMGYVRAAAGTGLVVLLGATGFRLWAGQDVAYVLGYELATHVTLIVAVIALGHSVRMARRLQRRNDQVMRLVDRQEEMDADARVRDDRLRLARELHDSMGHSLAVAALYADVARESGAVGEEREALEQVRASVSEAMGQLRRTVTVLRGRTPSSPASPGLEQVRELAAAPEAAGYRVDMHIDDVVVSDAVAEAAFRIVQESITNTLRHSPGSHITIGVRQSAPDQVEVSVRDDGVVAGPPSLRAGHGLSGMDERVRALGGRLRVESGVRGWRVLATLPGGETT